MSDLPHYWHWDGDAAVYDGGGHLRYRVEIDDDDNVRVIGVLHMPAAVLRALLDRHAEPGTPVWEGDCPSCGAHLDVQVGDEPEDHPCIIWTPASANPRC